MCLYVARSAAIRVYISERGWASAPGADNGFAAETHGFAAETRGFSRGIGRGFCLRLGADEQVGYRHPRDRGCGIFAGPELLSGKKISI